MTDEIISTETENVEVVAEVAEEVLTESVEKTEEAKPVSEEKAEEPNAEKNPRKDAQARINQLTKQKNDAIAEAEYWKSKASESEGSRRDLAEHEAEKAQTKIESIDKESWSAKVESTLEELPDYQDVVGSSKAIVEPHVASVILESDIGPKLFHYLAKNPNELEQLNDMTERGAIKAIAKLELMLETKPKPEVKTSKAPDPITPVSKSHLPVVSKDLENASMDDFIARRKKDGSHWVR
jgi:hypothetical protein